MPFDNANYEPADKLLAVLRAMRAFHSDPPNWCTTRRANGHLGVSRCIITAVPADTHFNAVEPYLRAALPDSVRHTPGGIVKFNEQMGTTHAELMAFYDRAIELRRAELLVTP